MRLLVSVRSVAEAEAAVWGGADIVDAKEPLKGSLGPVSPLVLRAILDRLPGDREASAALGDFSDLESVEESIGALLLKPRAAPVYLKLGFAGVSSSRQVETLIQAGLAASVLLPTSAPIIAVGYADSEAVGALPPEAVAEAAIRSGAAGVLVDTLSKGDGHLFQRMHAERARSLFQEVRRAGLLTAVAGSLGIEQLELVRHVGADIVGFRGAICEGGREGRATRDRIEGIHRLLTSFGVSSVESVPSTVRPAWRNA
jgi:(5-formylfuran-3-yl)methyl phosphate synthase